MKESKVLNERRIAVLVADGFEKIELAVPVTALRAAGADVDIVSLRHGKIRGVNLHEPAGQVHVTKTLAEADPKEYDGLFIPGGFINPDLLRQSAEARKFVRAFDAAAKPIATLCHGPWVLASAGLLNGRTMTSWPGIRDDLVNAGANWRDEAIVRDNNIVTSRGPQDLPEFVLAITELFSEPAPVTWSEAPLTFSAPQRNEPPQLFLEAFRWAPRLSFRTVALTLCAVALLIPVLRRRLAA